MVVLAGSQLRRIASGVIRTRGDDLASRLADLQLRLTDTIAAHAPETAALESIFVARNLRSALVLGHARGVALATCGVAGLVAREHTPQQVKAAVTGHGHADKVQVARMVQRLLGLAAVPPSDEADALAVAICAALTLRTLERLSPRPARAEASP